MEAEILSDIYNEIRSYNIVQFILLLGIFAMLVTITIRQR